jgi:hypothetical protein
MSNKTEIAAALKQTILRFPDQYSYQWVISDKPKRGLFWQVVLDNYPKGFPAPKDKGQISSYYSKDRNAIREILANDADLKALRESDSAPSPVLNVTHNAQDAPPKALPTSQTLHVEHSLDDKIAQMVSKAVTEQLSLLAIPKHYEQTELVPEPTTIKGGAKGRKQNRLYWKKTISIDRTLWALFEKECKDLKIPVSRLIDTVLWMRYGKPKTTVEE